jgi:hypothetical protein
MKAIISYFRQKASNVLNVIIKHESILYACALTTIIFTCILCYQSTTHNLEILKFKKDRIFLEQHIEDSSSLIGAQRQVISNQEGTLKRASQVIQEQNSFIQKALQRIERLESLWANPDDWT